MTIENIKCPDCDGDMVSRLNKVKNSRFWGCKNFPRCKGTRDVNGLSRQDRHQLEEEDPEEPTIRWDRK